MNTKESTGAEDANKHQQPTKPAYISIIEGYLSADWAPAKKADTDTPTRFRIMTSQEIVLELADMADLELNDVAEAMTSLGYCACTCDGKVGWLMQHRSE